MNSINIHGRLARDLEINYTNSENPVAYLRFAVAVNRSYTKQGEDEKADFFNCVSFGKQAEAIYKHFKKGDGISIQGEIINDRYTDKNGEKKDKWQIKVDKFDFELIRKDAQSGTSQDSGWEAADPIEDEDLPF